MEFKDLLAGRRSVRKYSEREVPREVVERLLRETLTAPSSRNSRSTRLLVVEDPATVARMAAMRDYGSGFLTGAPRAIVVLGACRGTPAPQRGARRRAGRRLPAHVPADTRGVRAAVRHRLRLFGLPACAAASGRRRGPHHPHVGCAPRPEDSAERPPEGCVCGAVS